MLFYGTSLKRKGIKQATIWEYIKIYQCEKCDKLHYENSGWLFFKISCGLGKRTHSTFQGWKNKNYLFRNSCGRRRGQNSVSTILYFCGIFTRSAFPTSIPMRNIRWWLLCMPRSSVLMYHTILANKWILLLQYRYKLK